MQHSQIALAAPHSTSPRNCFMMGNSHGAWCDPKGDGEWVFLHLSFGKEGGGDISANDGDLHGKTTTFVLII